MLSIFSTKENPNIKAKDPRVKAIKKVYKRHERCIGEIIHEGDDLGFVPTTPVFDMLVDLVEIDPSVNLNFPELKNGEQFVSIREEGLIGGVLINVLDGVIKEYDIKVAFLLAQFSLYGEKSFNPDRLRIAEITILTTRDGTQIISLITAETQNADNKANSRKIHETEKWAA